MTAVTERLTVPELQVHRDHVAAAVLAVDTALTAVESGRVIDTAALLGSLAEHRIVGPDDDSILAALYAGLTDLRDALTEIVELRKVSGTDSRGMHHRLLHAAEEAARASGGTERARVLLEIADRWANVADTSIMSGGDLV